MKKCSVIALCVILSIAVILGGGIIYVTESPEYAMLQMAVQIVEDGYDGIKPYLTENAENKIEPLVNLAQNKIVKFIRLLLPGTAPYDEIEWSGGDVIKNRRKCTVTIGFKYQDVIEGTIDVELIKSDGEWMINNLRNLNFTEFPFPW